MTAYFPKAGYKMGIEKKKLSGTKDTEHTFVSNNPIKSALSCSPIIPVSIGREDSPPFLSTSKYASSACISTTDACWARKNEAETAFSDILNNTAAAAPHTSIVYLKTDDMLYSGGNGTGLSFYIKYAPNSTDDVHFHYRCVLRINVVDMYRLLKLFPVLVNAFRDNRGVSSV